MFLQMKYYINQAVNDILQTFRIQIGINVGSVLYVGAAEVEISGSKVREKTHPENIDMYCN